MTRRRTTYGLPRRLRRRLEMPRAVEQVTVDTRLMPMRDRGRLLRSVRRELAAAGFSGPEVYDQGWRLQVRSGVDAERTLAADEAVAEHDDQWWRGAVVWSRDDGSTRVVAPVSVQPSTLEFLAWGGDAALALDTIRRVVG